jgi:hypothetical protein
MLRQTEEKIVNEKAPRLTSGGLFIEQLNKVSTELLLFSSSAP